LSYPCQPPKPWGQALKAESIPSHAPLCELLPKTGSVAAPHLFTSWLPQSPGQRLFDLEEILDKQRWILQALQALSQQLAQAERQWKKQLGPPGQARPEGGWVSDLSGTQSSNCGRERGSQKPAFPKGCWGERLHTGHRMGRGISAQANVPRATQLGLGRGDARCLDLDL
jgi:hypothetical protein